MSKTAKRLPQAMRPSGRIGRMFGFLMRRLNGKAYRWTLEQLRPVSPSSLLEIGFGTGDLMALAIRNLKLARTAGVDPSELMVETARKRLRRFGKKTSLDIRQGDDATLPDGPFDAVAALHSFQFWANPDGALKRIRERIAPKGRLILVLRMHGSGKKAAWLPNPLSRSGNEIVAACEALERAGFRVVGLKGISKSSQGIVAAPV